MSMDSGAPNGDGRKLGGGAIATLGGLGVLAIFMLQNTQDASVEFLVWDFTWPVWAIVLVSAALGAFVWLGLGILRRHRRRKERRQDGRDVDAARRVELEFGSHARAPELRRHAQIADPGLVDGVDAVGATDRACSA